MNSLQRSRFSARCAPSITFVVPIVAGHFPSSFLSQEAHSEVHCDCGVGDSGIAAWAARWHWQDRNPRGVGIRNGTRVWSMDTSTL